MKNELIEQLVREFFETQFAVNPTEIQEPFFWKWSDHGREVITDFLRFALLKVRDATIEECMRAVPKEKPTRKHIEEGVMLEFSGTGDGSDIGFNDCRTDILQALSALRTNPKD